MAETTSIKLGPPFLGMTDDPFAMDGSCLYCENFIPRKGRLERRPGIAPLTTDMKADLGCHACGWRDKTVTVTVGRASVSDDVYVYVNRKDLAYSVNLTDRYNEFPRSKYSFAELSGHLYFAAGCNVFDLDLTSLGLTLLTMSAGSESGTKSYLRKAPPAKQLVSHLNRLWFFNIESADLPVFGLTTTDANQTDDLSWIKSSSHVNYSPRHALYSDPYHPGQVASLSNIAVEDGDAPAIGGYSYMGGLAVLTTKSAFYLSGQTRASWRLDRLGMGGCINPLTISGDETAVYWLGTDGFYFLEGTTVQRMTGVDWLWSGSTPAMVEELYENFTSNLTNSAKVDELSFAVDRKQGIGLLLNVARAFYPTNEYRFHLCVDLTTKKPFFWTTRTQESDNLPSYDVVGSASGSEVGSNASDLLIGSSAGLFYLNIKTCSDYQIGSTTGRDLDSWWFSTYREGLPAYLRVLGIDIVTGVTDTYSGGVLSEEQCADFRSYAGNPLYSDTGFMPELWERDKNDALRWYPGYGGAGYWLADDATDGPRWMSAFPGVRKLRVNGHGRACSAYIVGNGGNGDAVTESPPIDAIYMRVTPDGDR